MNSVSLIACAATASLVQATNFGTPAYQNCDKKAAARCVSGYCCSSNMKKSGVNTAITAICMPNTKGATSNTWKDPGAGASGATAVITGGAKDDEYTFSCNSHAAHLTGATLAAAAAIVTYIN